MHSVDSHFFPSGEMSRDYRQQTYRLLCALSFETLEMTFALIESDSKVTSGKATRNCLPWKTQHSWGPSLLSSWSQWTGQLIDLWTKCIKRWNHFINLPERCDLNTLQKASVDVSLQPAEDVMNRNTVSSTVICWSPKQWWVRFPKNDLIWKTEFWIIALWTKPMLTSEWW